MEEKGIIGRIRARRKFGRWRSRAQVVDSSEEGMLFLDWVDGHAAAPPAHGTPEDEIAEQLRECEWSVLAIPFSRGPHAVAASLLLPIRQGVPHVWRSRVYCALTGVLGGDDPVTPPQQRHVDPGVSGKGAARAASLKEDLATYGTVPQVPVFGGVLNLEQHPLTRDGKRRVGEILFVLRQQSADLTYCPILPDLIAVLVYTMDADDAYAVVRSMITESRADGRYFHFHRGSWGVLVHSLRETCQRVMPKVTRHLADLGVAVEDVGRDFLVRLFVGVLPHAIVLRVVDAYMSEGVKILLRVAMAILVTGRQLFLECRSADQVNGLAVALASSCTDADLLMATAFRLRLSRSKVLRFDESNEHEAVTEFDDDEVFYVPKADVASEILSAEQLVTLWAWLPVALRARHPKRVFSTSVDGTSLHLFYQTMASLPTTQPTILLVSGRSTTGDDVVIGALVTTPWTSKHGDSYFGGPPMLFEMTPREQHFGWDPEARPNAPTAFQHASEDHVAVGGGPGGGHGIYISRDFSLARSQRCAALENRPLGGGADTTREVEIDVDTVEVYRLV